MTSYPPLAPTAEQSRRIRDADEALARTPQDPDAIVDAALAREKVWRYQESIDLHTLGEGLAPSDYRFPLGRAHRLIRSRKFEDAMDDLDRALELDPYGFNTAYLRGFTRYVTGDFAAAARDYDRAFRLSRSPEALALARSGEMPGDPRHCMLIEEDLATRIAITTWAFRALSGARASLRGRSTALRRG